MQVVDYAIARKIVTMHNNGEDTVERVYTQEEVLRYISFARQFKPIISEVSDIDSLQLLYSCFQNYELLILNNSHCHISIDEKCCFLNTLTNSLKNMRYTSSSRFGSFSFLLRHGPN